MSTLEKLSEYVEHGKGKEARALTQKLLGENISANNIVQKGIIAGLDAIGEKTKGGKSGAGFEDRFSEFLGLRHALVVNSGSSANILAIGSRWGRNQGV